MDYKKFVDELPSLYKNWTTNEVEPISPKFKASLEKIKGMTTSNVMQLLNHAVGCLETNEIYCEVGSFHGSTLIGALINHPNVVAYAVDNFSEFDKTGENLEILNRNLSQFGLKEQVLFHNKDFEEFFFDLKEAKPDFKIGVYLYDGAHDYRSQFLGLLLAVPFLASKALIIVDDANWGNVRQANFDFLSTYPQATLIMDIPTRKDQDSTFWNGIQVISWDETQNNHYSWQNFSRNFRNVTVIKSIYNLSWDFELKYKLAKINELERKAIQLEKLRRTKEAEDIYTRILRLSQNHSFAWYRLGVIFYEKEKYKLALQLIQQSLLIESNNNDAQSLLNELIQKINDQNLICGTHGAYKNVTFSGIFEATKQQTTEQGLRI